VLFVGTVAAYGRREIFDTGAFTKRAVDVIHVEPVRQQLAETLTRQAIEAGSPDLVGLRPLIEGTISRLLDTGALDPVLSSATSEIHRSIFSPGGSPLVLSLADALVVTRGVIAAVRPGTTLPASSTVGEVEVADRDDTRALRAAHSLRWLGAVLPIVGVILLGLAIALAPQRRRAVTSAGMAVATAGLLVLLTSGIARPVVVNRFEGDLTDVARATWNGLLGAGGWCRRGRTWACSRSRSSRAQGSLAGDGGSRTPCRRTRICAQRPLYGRAGRRDVAPGVAPDQVAVTRLSEPTDPPQ
jgi:hypothetical protein